MDRKNDSSTPPSDEQLRVWFDQFGPPPLDDTVRFNRTRWVNQTAPGLRRSRTRRPWGWSVAVASLLVGFVGGGAWLAHRRSPSTAAPPRVSAPAAVAQAMAWLDHHTSQPLAAPTWVPSPPASAGGPHLSAQTRVYHVSGATGFNGWSVILYPTSVAYRVNNPALDTAHVHPWVSWTGQQLSGMQSAMNTPSDRLQTLEGHNGNIGPNGPQITSRHFQTVALGLGITGTLYTTDVVLWHQGSWTLMVIGGQGAQDVTVARSVVRRLHDVTLPPYPALAAIAGDRYQAQFSGNQVAIDWIHGADLTTLNGAALPVASVFRIASSWRPVPGR